MGRVCKKLQREGFGRLLEEGIKKLAAARRVSLRQAHDDLADRLAVSTRTIYDWRKGKRLPQPELVAGLAHVFVSHGEATNSWVRAFLRKGDYGPSDSVDRLLQELFPAEKESANIAPPTSVNERALTNYWNPQPPPKNEQPPQPEDAEKKHPNSSDSVKQSNEPHIKLLNTAGRPWFLSIVVSLTITFSLTVILILRLGPTLPESLSLIGLALVGVAVVSPAAVFLSQSPHRLKIMAALTLLANLILAWGWMGGLPVLANVYNERGIEAFKAKNIEAARRDFERAIALDAAPAFYQNLAEIYESTDELPRAVEIYEQAIERDKNFTPAYQRLSYLYNRLGNFEAAQRKADAGLGLASQHADVDVAVRYGLLSSLGWAYFEQTKTAPAQTTLEEAVALEEALKELNQKQGGEFRRALPHYYLAQLYEQANLPDEAKVQWQEAWQFFNEANGDLHEWRVLIGEKIPVTLHYLLPRSAEVRLKRSRWSDFFPATFATALGPTDQIEVKGEALVLCADLRVKRISGFIDRNPCGFELAILTYQDRSFINRENPTATAKLPYIIYPRNTLVLDSRPALLWHDTGAVSYTVGLIQGKESLWVEQVVTGNQLLYPADAPPLQPGIDYRLLVRDNTSGQNSDQDPAKGIGFRLANSTELTSIAAGREQIMALTELTDPERDFALALYYAGLEDISDSGFYPLGEAWQIMDTLTQTQNSPALHLWRARLLAQLKLANEAATAYQAAKESATTLGDIESEAAAYAGLWCLVGDKAEADGALLRYQQLGHPLEKPETLCQ